MLGIIESLLCLVEVGILRSSSLRHDNDVCPVLYGLPVHLIEICASHAVSFGNVACNAVDDVLVFIEYYIDDEAQVAECL